MPRRALLAAVLGAGFALRVAFARNDDGLYWPDEIFQSLEPAHRLAFGYGLVAWEFIDGARSWLMPGLFAGLLKLCAAAGLTSPRSYLHVIELGLCATGTATAYGSYRLTRALNGSYPAALFATALFSFGALELYFAPRALSETLSALPLTFGFAWSLPEHTSARRRWAGTALLGLATWLRLQNGVFCAVLLATWAARRDRKAFLEGTLVFCLCALAMGALDRWTWGAWFHSAQVYLRFNLIEGRASDWGTSPGVYYLHRLVTSMPTEAPLLLGLPWLASRRAPPLFAAAVLGLALHSAVPHKELRFIFPLLPLLGTLAGLGGEELVGWLGRRRLGRTWMTSTTVAGYALCLASAALFPRLTFGALGQYGGLRRKDSAFDDGGTTNRLLLRAHEQPDLCGLKIETRHLAWTGGSTYLHRPVRIYPSGGPPRDSGLFNYVIMPLTFAREAGLKVVANEGKDALAQIGRDCRPDPGYSWRLP